MVFSSARPLQAGIGANAFVAVVVAKIALLIEPVEDDDFALEGAVVRRCGRLAMAAKRELVQLFPVEAVDLRHHLGAGELAELVDAVAPLDRLRPRPDSNARLHRQDDRRAHRDAGHAFDPGGDNDVLRPAHHRLGGEMQRLL